MTTKHRFEKLSSRLLRAFTNTNQPDGLNLTLESGDPNFVDIGEAPLSVRWLYYMMNEIDVLISQLSKQTTQTAPGDENRGTLEMEKYFLDNQNEELFRIIRTVISEEVNPVIDDFCDLAFSKDWHVLVSNQQLRERVHEPLVEQIPAGDQKKYH